MEAVQDLADATLADWDEKNSDKLRKGWSRYVVPVNADGNPLVYGGVKRLEFQQAASQEERDLTDEEGAEIPGFVPEPDLYIERDRPEGGYNPAEYGDGVTDPA